MKKVLGIFSLLIVIMGITSAIEPGFLKPINLQNLAKWVGLFGIISIGEAFVIITGGIDLSVGSIIGLVASILGLLLNQHQMSIPLAILICLAISVFLGYIHGILVTKLRLQPFIVTLCGLFLYRGAGRFITGDSSLGFPEPLKDFARSAPITLGMIPIKMPFIILIVIAIITGIFLHMSIYGRYLLALGRNEEAAHYSGINTDRMILSAYIFSAALAGLAGILFALDVGSVQASTFGNFYELYAIAGAVLGGCSLRGGEGTIIGVIIGTAIVRVLYNAINILGIATQLEFTVIGAVILLGVLADELVKRITAARRAAREAQALSSHPPS